MKDSICISNNNSRAIVSSDSNITPRIPFSCFINVSIARNRKALHDPLTKKVRIKVPKLLLRAVKRNGGHFSNDPAANNNNNKNSVQKTKKLGKARKLLPKKFASFWSNLFGSKKSSDTSSFNGSKNYVVPEQTQASTRTELEEFNHVGEETPTPNRTELGELEPSNITSVGIRNSSNSASIGSRNGSNIGKDDPSLIPIMPLSEIRSLPKVEDKNMKQKMLQGKSLQQSIVAHQLHTPNIPGSFLKFLNKGKVITRGSNNGDTGNAGGVDDCSIVRQSAKAFQVTSRLQIGFLVGKPWFSEKARSRDNKEEGNTELCKKRILMGERCRPLSL